MTARDEIEAFSLNIDMHVGIIETVSYIRIGSIGNEIIEFGLKGSFP